MYKNFLRTALVAAALLPPLMAQAQAAPSDAPGGILLPAADLPPPPANTVPEPGSVALVALALGASLVLRARRVQRRAAPLRSKG